MRACPVGASAERKQRGGYRSHLPPFHLSPAPWATRRRRASPESAKGATATLLRRVAEAHDDGVDGALARGRARFGGVRRRAPAREGPAWIAVEAHAKRRTRKDRRRSARRLLHLGLLGPTASHAVPWVNLRARRAREPARPGHEAVGRSSAEFRARTTLWRPPPAVPRGDDQRAMANRAEPGPPFRPLLWKANVSKLCSAWKKRAHRGAGDREPLLRPKGTH